MVRLPKHGLHKPSGRGRVVLNGKSFYTGTWGTPEAEAEYRRLVGEWKASGGQLSFGSKPTVAMVFADYLKWCEKNYPGRAYTEADVCRHCFSFAEEYHDLDAEQFSPLKLKAVREKMIATGNSRKHINGMISRIVKAYRWAAENELVSITTTQALANVRGLQRGRCEAPDHEPVKPVDDAIVDVTIKHCRPIVKAMIQFQRLTGARPGEICKMTPDMIDRSGDVWVADFGRLHKTAHHGKSRVIFIGPKAQKILQPYLFCDPCFGYLVSSYRRAIHRACDKAFPAPKGLSDAEKEKWQSDNRWSPNRIRHTAATEIRKRFGAEAASVILGHSKLSTTEIYAEKNLAAGMKIIREVG